MTTQLEDGTVVGDETPEELGIDYLNTLSANEEREDQVTKELLLLAGTYTTVPNGKGLTVQRSTREGPNKGRLSLRFFQQVFMETKEINPETGEPLVERGFQNYSISPEFRKNPKGKWDLQTRLYLNAKVTLIKSGGTYTGPGSVASFLTDYPVRLRISRLDGNEQYPDPSNLVMSISAVKLDEV